MTIAMEVILTTTLLKSVLPILAVLVAVRLLKPTTTRWIVECTITVQYQVLSSSAHQTY